MAPGAQPVSDQPRIYNCHGGSVLFDEEDIRTLFTEVFGVDPALKDAAVIETGCARLRKLIRAGDIPLSLSAHGACPSLEYVSGALAPEDFGEFTHEEMYHMVSACYQ